MQPENLENILEELQAQVRILTKKLATAEKNRKRIEFIKEKNYVVLDKVNKELAFTVQKLKETQVQLIQADKMASLGQLIAGISHEINTPAGAIVSASSEINKDYDHFLEQLLHLTAELPKEILPLFFSACDVILKFRDNKGTLEVRETAKKIEKILSENGVSEAHTVSKNLSTIGFNLTNIDCILPLSKSPLFKKIYQMLFMLGMNKIHLRDIQIGIQKIVHLVRSLKLYSRSEHDEIGITKLEEDIQTTLTILNNRIKHGITVVKEFDPIPEVRCHADQLNQVWTNLINNAIESMKGKGQIIIRIKQHNENSVRVEIEDNGPGIPLELQSKIFDPYFTTKPKGEGTGLGLSISQDIIDKHQGVLLFESAPGKTLFKVILPLETKTSKSKDHV